MATRTRKTSNRIKTNAAPTCPDAADDLAANGAEADYVAFLPAAMAIPAAEVLVMRADPDLVRHNVDVGTSSVLAVATRAAGLPETDMKEITALPRLASALVFACTQTRPVVAIADLAPKVHRCMELRGLMLDSADALVRAKLLAKVEVDEIRAGHGSLDAANDLVALTALFRRERSNVSGRHPVTDAQITEAAELGTELGHLLSPARARPIAPSQPAPGDERDRLWTLLVRGHDRLQRAGAYLFGLAAVPERVPPLQSARGRRRDKNGAAPPGPVVPADPA